ncbi:hypothetical protein CBR_g39538 [Chara braunii]|uniref:Uncharacterized protein n=1 Tax=Chara braunii TaxID=69332 RepID=A0A388LRX7_CHABU|nr:hypothetical protein CBR_g39538 [Chara braunii]|eukprot:GBG85074.1 hypothetical protein CBR_g39538 [Chara braunii]
MQTRQAGGGECAHRDEDIMDQSAVDEVEAFLDRQARREADAMRGTAEVGREGDSSPPPPHLRGEEVVMTANGTGGGCRDAEQRERERGKRGVDAVDDDISAQGRKRPRKMTIDEVYDGDAQQRARSTFLQWVYDAGIPFRAFRRSSWRRHRKAVAELPRGVRMVYPSFKEIGDSGVIGERDAMHGAALHLFRSKSKRRSLVQPVETRFASVLLMLLWLKERRDALQSMLHDDAWDNIPWESQLGDQAVWVRQTIRDGLFWWDVEYGILVMTPIHQLLRRLDRGGMVMSLVYSWSRLVVAELRLLQDEERIPSDIVDDCIHQVLARRQHMLAPPHATTHLLNPRRHHLRYYDARVRTAEDLEVVQECDSFFLAQAGGDRAGTHYLRNEVRAVAAEGGSTGPVDEEPEPLVRPHTSMTEEELAAIRRRLHQLGSRRPRPVSEVFGARAAVLLPYEGEVPEEEVVDGAAGPARDDAVDDDDNWTDLEEIACRANKSLERLYFAQGGHSTGAQPQTTLMRAEDDPPRGASDTRHGTGRGAGTRRTRDATQPRRRVFGVDSSDDERMVQDDDALLRARHSSAPEVGREARPLRRSERLVSRDSTAPQTETACSQHLEDILGNQVEGEQPEQRTPAQQEPSRDIPFDLRTRDSMVGGEGTSGGNIARRQHIRVGDMADYYPHDTQREETQVERDALIDAEGLRVIRHTMPLSRHRRPLRDMLMFHLCQHRLLHRAGRLRPRLLLP